MKLLEYEHLCDHWRIKRRPQRQHGSGIILQRVVSPRLRAATNLAIALGKAWGDG